MVVVFPAVDNQANLILTSVSVVFKRETRRSLVLSTMISDIADDEERQGKSIKELKDGLKKSLIDAGVNSTILTQLRKEVITGLKSTESKSRTSLVVQDRILFSLIHHTLKNRKLVNSISVFLPESGLSTTQSLLSENDIIQMVRFNQISNSYKHIHSEKENVADSLTADMIRSNKNSILDIMTQFCLNVHGSHSKEIACQTEAGGPSVREFLDVQISDLQKAYQKNKELQYLTPSKTIEERMFVFQRECEERFQVDLRLQIAGIRENELLKMRLEEASKCRAQLEQQRATLENEYHQRMQTHIEREAASARRIADQERELHRRYVSCSCSSVTCRMGKLICALFACHLPVNTILVS